MHNVANEPHYTIEHGSPIARVTRLSACYSGGDTYCMDVETSWQVRSMIVPTNVMKQFINDLTGTSRLRLQRSKPQQNVEPA